MSRESRVSTLSDAPVWPGGTTLWGGACRVLAVLTGFSIPLSTSFSEITTGLFMACWILSGDFAAKWNIIRRNRVALVSLALFGLLAAGMAWSSESWFDAGRCLLKYRELLYLPMFVVVFREARLRDLATWAYMAAAALLLGLSYFERLAGADFGIASTSVDYVIAKDRIIHSLMMAFLAYLAAVQCAEGFLNVARPRLPLEQEPLHFSPLPPGEGSGVRGTSIGHTPHPQPLSRGERGGLARSANGSNGAPSSRGVFRVFRGFSLSRWLCAALVPLAVYNILFMVQGRTGYVVLGALTALFLSERLGRRGIAIAALAVALAGLGGIQFSSMIRGRVEQTISQLKNQFGPERKHSADPRMEFYANTLKLVARNPFLGTGTGSFRGEYAKLVSGSDDIPTSDPHNEYLHLAAQVGLPGTALFVLLLAVQWMASSRLSGLQRCAGRGVVLTIALGSLFNSLILSITGGLIFSYFAGLAFAEPAAERASGAGTAPPEHAAAVARRAA